jgi:short-chain fatty acids transporter
MVQGPIMIEAGKILGVSAPKIINSFSAGEVFSNMIQPFWAIPLLSIAGLNIRDIVGYCIMAFVLVTLVFFGAMAIF